MLINMITIKQVSNGLIVTNDNETELNNTIVFEVREDTAVEDVADFLRYLSDLLGPTTSRYSPQRIQITVEPGDKYER